MQQVPCPDCGAPIQFKSTASVLAVCEFCRTTVLKDAGSVVNLGKMSEVLEDYSPLQIGTSGQFERRSFSLIGRLQLQYSDGYWNEWYALFDDGSTGWLADASGQYVMTFPIEGSVQLPLFEKLVPGARVTVAGRTLAASDVRTAKCTAGQGELPFKVGAGYVARVADCRVADWFVTLDYSDGASPRVYQGRAVELTDLKPQLLRDPGTIRDSAGHFRGKVSALNCPSCGSAVKCVPGATVHIICPSCHAAVDISGDVAVVLAAGQAAARVTFTLALGSEATIAGSRYTILGAMRRHAASDGSAWSEYLLYSPGKPFIWLIESEGGWQRAKVLDRWPAWDGAGHAKIDTLQFNRSADYLAQIDFAVGSFNWRVKVGDPVHVTEFESGAQRLAAEVSREEMTWSLASPVPPDQIHAWFGVGVSTTAVPHPGYRAVAKRVLFPMLIVNAIPLFLATGSAFAYTLLAALAIYLPAYFLDAAADRKS